ncbi:hypothetical protein Trydic_g18059 [Trypoxylus dichotomus]
MLSTYNDESTTSKPSKTASDKIKIISQTFLKAASLTSRKELLNQALKNPDLNKFSEVDPKSTIISKQLFKSDEAVNKDKRNTFGNDQDRATKDVKSKKLNRPIEAISDSSDGEELNDNLSQSNIRETAPDSNSSAEFERTIRKTQVSLLDISGSDKLNNSRNAKQASMKKKIKEKKKEVISDLSESEGEFSSNQLYTRNSREKKMEEIPSSSRSKSDKMKGNQRRIVRQTMSPSESGHCPNESNLDKTGGSEDIGKGTVLKMAKLNSASEKKMLKSGRESLSSDSDMDVNRNLQNSKERNTNNTEVRRTKNVIKRRKDKRDILKEEYSVSSSDSESNGECVDKESTLKDRILLDKKKISKSIEEMHNISSGSTKMGTGIKMAGRISCLSNDMDVKEYQRNVNQPSSSKKANLSNESITNQVKDKHNVSKEKHKVSSSNSKSNHDTNVEENKRNISKGTSPKDVEGKQQQQNSKAASSRRESDKYNADKKPALKKKVPPSKMNIRKSNEKMHNASKQEVISSSDSDSDVEKDQGNTSISTTPKTAKLSNTKRTANQENDKRKVSKDKCKSSSSESESNKDSERRKSALKTKVPPSKIRKSNEKMHNTSKQEVISSSDSNSDVEKDHGNTTISATPKPAKLSKTTRTANQENDKHRKPALKNKVTPSKMRNISKQEVISSSDSDSDVKTKSYSEKNKETISKQSSSSRSRSPSSGFSSDSDSDSSKNIKRNKKGSSSSGSTSNSDSENNKKAKRIQSNSTSLKRKYSDMMSSDDNSDNDKRTIKKLKQKKMSAADKLLETFSNENQYELVESKQQNYLGSLGKDEEIYLLQICKSVDPNLLIGKTISFDGPSKLKIGKSPYISDINTTNQNGINILNFTDLVHLQPKGLITIQPRIKSVNSSLDVKPVDDIVEAPNDLKLRHPLFGTDYEEKITLEEDIERKLNEIVVDIGKKHKKKSKKKRRDTQILEDGIGYEDRGNENDDIPDVIRLLNEHIGQAPKDREDRKKKKKSKHKVQNSDDVTSQMEKEADSILSQMISDFEIPKKKRKDRLSQSLDVVMKSFEKPSNVEVNRIFNHSIHDSIDNIEDCSQSKKKKKKKHKDSMDLIDKITSTPNIFPSQFEDLPKKVKKSKKHPFETVDSGNKAFVFSTPDVAHKLSKREKRKDEERNEQKLKKKHRKDVVVNSTMSTSTASDSILHLDESSIPKVRTKKHKDSLDNFINDLVKDVTSSDETSQSKKKKRKKNHDIE